MKNMENTRKRNLTRVTFASHALVRFKSGITKRTIKAIVRDISLDSAFIYCNHEFKINDKVSLEIVLLGKSSELIIKIPGRIIRTDDEGTAISFDDRLEWWPLFSQFKFKQIDKSIMKRIDNDQNQQKHAQEASVTL